MNNENIQYDKLPVIDIENDKFMDLNQDLSIDLISSFIGKQVIYRKYENDELFEDIGTLKDIKDNKLYINHYDNIDIIPLEDIRDLEALETKTISKEYIGKICEITNIHGDKNIVYISNIDDLEIEFNYKILENNQEEILTSYYPVGLVENIVIIDSMNKDINKYTFETYIVDKSNQEIKDNIMKVINNLGKSYNPLFIYGNEGLGKTHLLLAIKNYIIEHSNKKVLYTTGDMFIKDWVENGDNYKQSNSEQYINFKNKYINVDVFIVDNIQYLINATKTQQEFCDIIAKLYNDNKQLIFSSTKKLDELELEKELIEKLRLGLNLEIPKPSMELKCKIIKQEIKNTTIYISDEVKKYIAEKSESIRDLQKDINTLLADITTKEINNIDLDTVKEALI